RLADSSRFDYYCWDLYSRVTEWYEADKSRLEIRAAGLRDLEHGGNATAELGAFIVDRIVRTHLQTMAPLNLADALRTDQSDRRFAEQAHGGTLWSTTSAEGDPGAPPFGHAHRIYNVIDSRQMYLQALLSQALRTLGHPKEAENSIHFSYEMVALSHETARQLGYQLAPGSEEAAKPFVEVSGRKGLGVKVDDLIALR